MEFQQNQFRKQNSDLSTKRLNSDSKSKLTRLKKKLLSSVREEKQKAISTENIQNSYSENIKVTIDTSLQPAEHIDYFREFKQITSQNKDMTTKKIPIIFPQDSYMKKIFEGDPDGMPLVQEMVWLKNVSFVLKELFPEKATIILFCEDETNIKDQFIDNCNAMRVVKILNEISKVIQQEQQRQSTIFVFSCQRLPEYIQNYVLTKKLQAIFYYGEKLKDKKLQRYNIFLYDDEKQLCSIGKKEFQNLSNYNIGTKMFPNFSSQSCEEKLNFMKLGFNWIINSGREQYFLAQFLEIFDAFQKLRSNEISQDTLVLRKYIEGRQLEIRQNAIRSYTQESSFCYLINRGLRNLKRPEEIVYIKYPAYHLYSQLFRIHQQQLLSQHHLFGGLTCYRGCRLTKEQEEQIIQSIGKKIILEGFISTTCKQNLSLKFGKHLFIIKLPACKKQDALLLQQRQQQGFYADISKFSELPDQQEVLFSPQCSFIVTSYDNFEKGGKNYSEIHLEFIPFSKSRKSRKKCIRSQNQLYFELGMINHHLANSFVFYEQINLLLTEQKKRKKKGVLFLLKQFNSDHKEEILYIANIIKGFVDIQNFKPQFLIQTFFYQVLVFHPHDKFNFLLSFQMSLIDQLELETCKNFTIACQECLKNIQTFSQKHQVFQEIHEFIKTGVQNYLYQSYELKPLWTHKKIELSIESYNYSLSLRIFLVDLYQKIKAFYETQKFKEVFSLVNSHQKKLNCCQQVNIESQLMFKIFDYALEALKRYNDPLQNKIFAQNFSTTVFPLITLITDKSSINRYLFLEIPRNQMDYQQLLEKIIALIQSTKIHDSMNLNYYKLNLGVIYIRINRVTQAKEKFRSCYESSLQNLYQNFPFFGHSSYYLGLSLLSLDELNEAEKYFRICIEDFKGDVAEKYRIRAYHQLFYVYLRQNKLRQCENTLKKGIRQIQSKMIEFSVGYMIKIDWVNLMIMLKKYQQIDFYIQSIQRGLKQATNLDLKRLWYSLIQLSRNLRLIKRSHTATKILLEIIGIYKKELDHQIPQKSRFERNLGILYSEIGDFNQAMKYLQRSYQKIKAQTMKRRNSIILETLQSMVEVCFKYQRYENGLKHLKECQKIVVQNFGKNCLLYVKALTNKGFTEIKLSLFSQAKQSVLEALQICNQINLKAEFTADICRYLGFIETKLLKNEQALAYYQKAQDIYFTIPQKSYDLIAQIYENIALIHQTNKNLQKSLTYFYNSIYWMIFHKAKAIQMLRIFKSYRKTLKELKRTKQFQIISRIIKKIEDRQAFFQNRLQKIKRKINDEINDEIKFRAGRTNLKSIKSN